MISMMGNCIVGAAAFGPVAGACGLGTSGYQSVRRFGDVPGRLVFCMHEGKGAPP